MNHTLNPETTGDRFKPCEWKISNSLQIAIVLNQKLLAIETCNSLSMLVNIHFFWVTYLETLAAASKKQGFITTTLQVHHLVHHAIRYESAVLLGMKTQEDDFLFLFLDFNVFRIHYPEKIANILRTERDGI